MAEKQVDGDAKLKEIQASIAEGKMMLQVLRSLPASENNDAFILRFEELVSRLERYKTQPRENADEEEVHTQLKVLKEKQDKIRSLLDQTAQEFQTSLIQKNEACGSSSKQKPNGVAGSTSEEPLKLSSAVENKEPPLAEKIQQQLTVNAERQTASPASKLVANGHVSESFDSVVSDTPAVNSHSSTAPANWSSLFSTQVAKLDYLIEDSKRFQSMVDRLITITRRAHLAEASGFLVDISSRFSELQKSFDSLKESYESIRDEPDMADDVREAQLLGFRDFLNNLDRNLETTKECFFTIYHLVKSNIDQGMADGSLEVDSDAEEGAPSSNTETAPSNSNPVNAEASTEPSPTASMRISRPDVSNMDPASSLKAQQVYLAALQDQTAVEREEIARLLRQRDQLAERLKTLKAAALTAKETAESKADDRNDENTLVCQAPIAVPESTDLAEQAELDEDEDVHPLLVSHLEAKKRELEGLKAQLALLRKAEERIAALNDSTRDIISSTTEVVGPDEVTPNPGVPVVKSRTSLARRNLTAASTGLQKTRFSDGSGEPSVSRGSSRLVESTNASGDQIPVNASGKFRGESFQVLEASGPNSNTEKLYENILEARIRREEQRRQGSTTAGVQNGILENDKSLQHAGYAGGTSVATSQDRTTLATWGGSSPIASGSTSRSSCPAEDEEAVSVSGSLPQSAEIATTSDVVPTVNTSRVISPPSGSAVYHRRSDRPSGDHSNSGLREPSMHKGISLAPDNAILGSLPQVGHSPSPIRRGQSAETTRTGSLKTLNKQSTESGGQPVSEPLQPNTAYFAKMSSALSGPYMTEEHSPELRSRAFTDRIQHLEHSVSQLYQICHSLMQENTQLNSAVTQLLAHSTVTPIQHSQWPQTLVTFPMSDGTSAPAPIPQTVSGGIFGNLLVSQSSQIQPSFVQSNPVVATPCTQVMGGPSHASVCGASMMDSGHGPANSNHEQMQLLMRRLMQQQIGYFNAQTELQRVLYQQSQTRQPLDLGFPPAPASNFSSQLMSPISYPPSIHPAAMLPMASNLPDPRTLFIPTVASGHPVVQQHGDPHLNLISPPSSVLGLGNAPPMSGGFTANTDMRNQFWIPSNMNMGRRGPI